MFETFDIISTYSRAQAIDDGALVDVTQTAKEAGFLFPVALTRSAYEDSVAWTPEDNRQGRRQDQNGRLWDVLWMLRQAIKRGGEQIDFMVYRVPRKGNGRLPRPRMLKALCGPGDDMQPVITIMLPEED